MACPAQVMIALLGINSPIPNKDPILYKNNNIKLNVHLSIDLVFLNDSIFVTFTHEAIKTRNKQ